MESLRGSSFLIFLKYFMQSYILPTFYKLQNRSRYIFIIISRLPLLPLLSDDIGWCARNPLIRLLNAKSRMTTAVALPKFSNGMCKYMNRGIEHCRRLQIMIMMMAVVVGDIERMLSLCFPGIYFCVVRLCVHLSNYALWLLSPPILLVETYAVWRVLNIFLTMPQFNFV